MRKIGLFLSCLLISGVAVADPATFVEIALIDGGENGRNGSGDQFGFEATGDYGFNEHWYVGGALGQFERDSSGGDIENTYFNVHGGYVVPVADPTGVNLEAGLWLGDQDNPGDEDTDPRAFEIKAGVNHSLSDKFGIFGTLAWVHGDLDTPQDSDLRNYVWSLGGAYSISERVSINLKIVNGVNG
ncbi:MAG TPA: outer membrane beta-barrel protein, partial [Candidatus Polarisedimenticolaceae bacterium]|nr:outer membrane beta-barrel protein [Candidatus Polarisedimenticolaceae bacterium]